MDVVAFMLEAPKTFFTTLTTLVSLISVLIALATDIVAVVSYCAEIQAAECLSEYKRTVIHYSRTGQRTLPAA